MTEVLPLPVLPTMSVCSPLDTRRCRTLVYWMLALHGTMTSLMLRPCMTYCVTFPRISSPKKSASSDTSASRSYPHVWKLMLYCAMYSSRFSTAEASARSSSYGRYTSSRSKTVTGYPLSSVGSSTLLTVGHFTRSQPSKLRRDVSSPSVPPIAHTRL